MRCSSTLHLPLDEGNGWKFQVHSAATFGVRDADWSLNADGTAAVPGVEEDEPAAEPIGASRWILAIERMERMNPQELFETFDDMELAWGPNWSGSLKSLWLGTRARRSATSPSAKNCPRISAPSRCTRS